jgi:hypothetical protein
MSTTRMASTAQTAVHSRRVQRYPGPPEPDNEHDARGQQREPEAADGQDPNEIGTIQAVEILADRFPRWAAAAPSKRDFAGTVQSQPQIATHQGVAAERTPRRIAWGSLFPF